VESAPFTVNPGSRLRRQETPRVDLAAAVSSVRHSGRPAVTVSIHRLDFVEPTGEASSFPAPPE
jgi:hypothetical protein